MKNIAKKLFPICLILMLSSCANSNSRIPKQLTEDILASGFTTINSVFEINRPVTTFYLDSVLPCRPHKYFSNSKFWFDKKYYLDSEGEGFENNTECYFFNYKCTTEEIFICFMFTKSKNLWKLKDIVVDEPIDFIR